MNILLNAELNLKERMGNWCMLEMKRFLGNRLVGVRTNPSVALVVGGHLSQQTGGVLFFVC